MIMRTRPSALVLPTLGVALAALVLAGLPGLFPPWETAAAAQEEAGRGALRPYVHVFVAYGIAWVLILVWVWRIARGLKRVQDARARDQQTLA